MPISSSPKYVVWKDLILRNESGVEFTPYPDQRLLKCLACRAVRGGPVRRFDLMEDQQQRRDGDHRDCCGDEDSAGGTHHVDVVLSGHDKHVGRDRERCAEESGGGPEGIDAEE